MLINNELFNQSITAIQTEGLAMDVVEVWQEGTIFKHVFNFPEKKGAIRSISKPIVCLCYGIAIEKGLFPMGLDQPIMPFLKEQIITNEENIPFLEKLTIYNLLTLTLGHEEKMLDSKHVATITGQNYADVVLNAPIKHAAGEYFIYTNAATYLASVVFQNATGKKLLEFAKQNIFVPLGITDVLWAESPQGYNMGCTGIEIFADDLIKIGRLLLNGGVYEGNRIVSEKWVKSMLSPKIETPKMYDEKRVLPKFAYGFNMWICKDGIAYCDGTDGQYLIIVPNKKMVIVTLGHQSNMKPITVCLEKIIH